MSQGRITTEFTVWCGRCVNWETLSNASPLKPPAQAAKELGWKVNREFKWLCQECQAQLGMKPLPVADPMEGRTTVTVEWPAPPTANG